MSVQNWIRRSTILLFALTLALVAFGFASGKITGVTLQIQHLSAPDIDLHIEGRAEPRTPIGQSRGDKHTQRPASALR